MAKKSKEIKPKKEKTNIITIKEEDLPKDRDILRVSIIGRKKGAHKDVRLEADKRKCRKKVSQDHE